MVEYFEPYDTFNFGSSGDCIENVLWRVQQRESLAKLEITVIHGKIDVDKHPVNDIASGIIQIASNIFNNKKKGQTSLSLGYIFYH